MLAQHARGLADQPLALLSPAPQEKKQEPPSQGTEKMPRLSVAKLLVRNKKSRYCCPQKARPEAVRYGGEECKRWFPACPSLNAGSATNEFVL